MAHRNTRTRSGRRSPGLVRIAALATSAAFLASVLSKVWPLQGRREEEGDGAARHRPLRELLPARLGQARTRGRAHRPAEYPEVVLALVAPEAPEG